MPQGVRAPPWKEKKFKPLPGQISEYTHAADKLHQEFFFDFVICQVTCIALVIT